MTDTKSPVVRAATDEEIMAALDAVLASHAMTERLITKATDGVLTLSPEHLATLKMISQSCKRLEATYGVMIAVEAMVERLDI